MSTRRARIGVSACFLPADPQRNLFKGKTLLYTEQSLLHWIMSEAAVPLLLPTAGGAVTATDLIEEIDGLVLAGGSDMSPLNYGETPLRPEWEGDYHRDIYEMELVRLCLAADKPVLGVCRGAQLLNVTLGGSLYQDIATQQPGALGHRNWEIYDHNFHEVAFTAGSRIGAWYGSAGGRVNSVHHQALNKLGAGLVVEARSVPDGIVEAIRLAPLPGGPAPFAYAVQWHPEFLLTTGDSANLDPRVLLRGFLAEVDARRKAP